MENQPNITLSQLADHLEKGELVHDVFDFRAFNGLPLKQDSKHFNCGTSGCAMGEMPALDSRFSFNHLGNLCFCEHKVVSKTIADYFRIEDLAAIHLFFPYQQEPEKYGGKRLKYEATKKEVIANIRAFIEISNKSLNQ